MPHLLVVDDEDAIRDLVAEVAGDAGYTVAQAGNLTQARLQIRQQRPDVVLLDMKLPDGDGIEFWSEVAMPDTQVVFITGHSTIESAIAAIRCGAVDYLQKPVGLSRIKDILMGLRNMLETRPTAAANDCFANILGQSRAIQMLRAHIAKVAPTRATVLLIGESGTGKELAAEAIHLASPRHRNPFLALNCGAISPNLVESELFGHEKGSFTGAERQHQGYFERVKGGTLFLDEITEMPMELQVRLLRVLETGRFVRVGTSNEIESDVRIIAATNRKPEEAVAEGLLRPDLYHRLSVFPLEVPPLRDRGSDIVLLANHFLQILNADAGTDKRFSADLAEAMKNYAWPGNIRELRNFVYRSYILGDEVISGDFDAFGLASPSEAASSGAASAGADIAIPVGMHLGDADRELILATLGQCNGNRQAAANLLGISVKTLAKRLDEYERAAAESERNAATPS